MNGTRANAKRTKTHNVELDWSRLLGFDQASQLSRGSDPADRRLRLAKVGTKIGGKPGVKARTR